MSAEESVLQKVHFFISLLTRNGWNLSKRTVVLRYHPHFEPNFCLLGFFKTNDTWDRKNWDFHTDVLCFIPAQKKSGRYTALSGKNLSLVQAEPNCCVGLVVMATGKAWQETGKKRKHKGLVRRINLQEIIQMQRTWLTLPLPRPRLGENSSGMLCLRHNSKTLQRKQDMSQQPKHRYNTDCLAWGGFFISHHHGHISRKRPFSYEKYMT